MSGVGATFLRVYLLRHGQSLNNQLLDSSFSSFASGRDPDAGLTQLGEEQAAALASHLCARQHLLDPPITMLYTSPMTRALATAVIIGSALNLRPVVWGSVHELGGCFQLIVNATGAVTGTLGLPGLSEAQIATTFPVALLHSATSGTDAVGWYKGVQRESEAEARERLSGVLCALQARAAALAGPAASDRSTIERPPCDGRWMGASAAAAAAATTAAAEAGPMVPGPVIVAPPTGAVGPHRSVFSANDVLRHTPAVAASSAIAIGSVYSDNTATSPPGACCSGAHHREAIAIVAHGDAIDVLLQLALSAAGAWVPAPAAQRGHEQRLQFLTGNAAMSVFDMLPDGSVRVIALNDAGHLTDHLRSGVIRY